MKLSLCEGCELVDSLPIGMVGLSIKQFYLPFIGEVEQPSVVILERRYI